MGGFRRPAVAGRFYPAHREVLLRDLDSYFEAADKVSAIGCVAPHAGYMYSGRVAGAVYSRLKLPRRFIILCPNHTGMGRPLAIMTQGAWNTPLGDAWIDEELARTLRETFPLLTEDPAAHLAEHSLEVQLPFLQALLQEFTFVPICVGAGTYEVLRRLGEAVAQVVERSGREILVIASSDMNHYESDKVTRVKDRKAIDQMLALNAEGLYETVRREQISMCGYGPTVAMLNAAKRLGATSAELVRYATSAETSGDEETVVGYAGIVVS